MERRQFLVRVDPGILTAMRPVLLDRIRQRREWEDLDDDHAVIEDILAELEERILSARAGIVEIEYFNGYFRDVRPRKLGEKNGA